MPPVPPPCYATALTNTAWAVNTGSAMNANIQITLDNFKEWLKWKSQFESIFGLRMEPGNVNTPLYCFSKEANGYLTSTTR